MVNINFDNEKVCVSYSHGPWYVQPLDNSWLWTIGAILNGERVVITDTRKELEDHQYNLSCTRGINKTNFAMLKELLSEYHPEERGFATEKEVQMIRETLYLNNRTVIDLRNLRDFVVAVMGDSDSIEDWDRMSAITHCIDTELVNRGVEV